MIVTAFLQEIERWRDLLARNIALRNINLTQREINFAVQQTIDRLIFLRIGEDRGIEPYGRLENLQKVPDTYQALLRLFYQADDRYNSGLFHFKSERGRPTPDTLTANLVIDDKILKDILQNLYYPDSPYEFSVLPADILGQVYEQFLGKVIRLTSGHRAVVEDKPEVKKAGGVYYTPTYIVDYIVKQTVGKLVEGKKPGPRGPVSKLKILDPACGSGSFLLEAYQYLLDWHRSQYIAGDPEREAKGRPPRLYQTADGDWQLTTTERKRILLDNIYGVDIDPQAVEVTKLSLLLKVLEGENEQTLATQLSFFQERVLPDLGENIKCGNSLIGPDFYDGQQMGFLDEDEMYRINVFDWEAEFPEIMGSGGFDAVIGNPPYIRIQAMKVWAPIEVVFYKQRYVAASKGNYDIYVVFVEKGLGLLKDKGRLGFILPHKFFNAQYGAPLRGLLAKGKHLNNIVHFGAQQVFAKATTYTCLLLLNKLADDKFHFTKAHDLSAWRQGEPQLEGNVAAKKATANEWNFVVGPGAELFHRLTEMPVRLGEVSNIFVGIQTSADDVFIMELVEDKGETLLLKSKALQTEWAFEKDLLFPLVSGTDVNRYNDFPSRQYLLFPYRAIGNSVELLDFNLISRLYPRTGEYFLENKERLEEREKGRMKGEKWYGYIYLKNMTRQSIEKICVPRLVEKLYAAYDREGNYFLDNVDVGGIHLKPGFQQQGLVYLLGLLNSKLLSWYFPFVSAPFRGGWLSANRQFLSQLPIRTIDFTDPTDKAHHDQMVELVERMLDLHKRLAEAKIPQAKTVLQRQIEATDQQIDKLVYELYDLTEEEIKIVEESVG